MSRGGAHVSRGGAELAAREPLPRRENRDSRTAVLTLGDDTPSEEVVDFFQSLLNRRFRGQSLAVEQLDGEVGAQGEGVVPRRPNTSRVANCEGDRHHDPESDDDGRDRKDSGKRG